ncbi:amidohydrolase 2 [Aspergillus heterothallicus]
MSLPRVSKIAGSHMQGKIALEEAVGSPCFFANATYPPKRLIQDFDGLPFDPEFVADINKRLDNKDLRLQSMDATGIRHAVVSLTSPGIEGVFDKDLAISFATQTNNAIYETYVKPHPDRFSFFACVALQDPVAAAAELERAVTKLGARGVLINGFTNLNEANLDEIRYLDDPLCEPFWAALARLNIPLYLHPRNPPPSQQLLYRSYPSLAQAAFGFGVETAGHALRIMCSGVLDRYPSVQIILGHCGEALPFMIHRVDERMKMAGPGVNGAHQRTLREYLRSNFYATLAGVRCETAFRATLQEMGADRVMFSVDYPFESNEEAADWFEELELGDELKNRVGWGNAERLLGLS